MSTPTGGIPVRALRDMAPGSSPNERTSDNQRAARALAEIHAAQAAIERALDHLSEADNVDILSIPPRLRDAMFALDLAASDAAAEGDDEEGGEDDY